MTTDADRLLSLKDNLSKRIANVEEYARGVSPAFAKEFHTLAAAMTPGDELWEWHWSEQKGQMYNYSNGWCIVRAGIPVDSYCYSFS